MKTIKALAKELAAREGKRKQVDIAQITELLGHLSDIFHELPFMVSYDLSDMLQINGEKRAKKKSKVKGKK